MSEFLHEYNKPEVCVRLGGRSLKARVQHADVVATGKAYQSETLSFGEVALEAGDHTVALWAEDFGEPKPRGVRLTEVSLVPKA